MRYASRLMRVAALLRSHPLVPIEGKARNWRAIALQYDDESEGLGAVCIQNSGT